MSALLMTIGFLTILGFPIHVIVGLINPDLAFINLRKQSAFSKEKTTRPEALGLSLKLLAGGFITMLVGAMLMPPSELTEQPTLSEKNEAKLKTDRLKAEVSNLKQEQINTPAVKETFKSEYQDLNMMQSPEMTESLVNFKQAGSSEDEALCMWHRMEAIAIMANDDMGVGESWDGNSRYKVIEAIELCDKYNL